jgi:aldose 1-epimerase
MLTLRNEWLSAQILPAIGGGLARLDAVAGASMRAVLRGLEPTTGGPPPTPSQLACFPLLPWSNRIGGGGFEFEGHRFALPSNRAGEACPIHGEGWQRPWLLGAQSASSVTLRLDQRLGAPFSYLAQLRYTLHGAALEVALEVNNRGSFVLPFGLGLHPWLVRTEGVTLQARAGNTWQRGDHGLPLRRMTIPDEWDFSAPRLLPGGVIDHIFEGWDGQGSIVWPETGMRLRISADMGYYIVYTRPGVDFFCFEPVDHMINAHNLPGGPAQHGLTLLAPGQVLARKVRFDVGVTS